MKVIAYTALHYGADYLAYAIRSVIDYIDEYYVLYTPIGSHGHRTDLPCPDTRETLMTIAHEAAGDRLRWYEGTWPHEGAHREAIHTLAPDADVIVVLDSDEIWSDGLLPYALGVIERSQQRLNRWRMPIIHYWRSFYRCVLHDPAFPVRLIYPKFAQGEASLEAWYGDGNPALINHMGYAQRSEVIYYKQHTHGHKNEFRRDVDWFRDVFMANRQTDCHIVGSEYWNPEPVDPLDYMPDWMQEHPYFKLEVIP